MLDRMLTYFLPSLLGFSGAFTHFFGTVESTTANGILAAVVTAVGIVLARAITKAPELINSLSTARRSREDMLSAQNAALIENLTTQLDHSRLRCDTLDEIVQLERLSKHAIRQAGGVACYHAQYRGILLDENHIDYPKAEPQDFDAIAKPFDDRIRELQSRKTDAARNIIENKAATQALMVPLARKAE